MRPSAYRAPAGPPAEFELRPEAALFRWARGLSIALAPFLVITYTTRRHEAGSVLERAFRNCGATVVEVLARPVEPRRSRRR